MGIKGISIDRTTDKGGRMFRCIDTDDRGKPCDEPTIGGALRCSRHQESYRKSQVHVWTGDGGTAIREPKDDLVIGVKGGVSYGKGVSLLPPRELCHHTGQTPVLTLSNGKHLYAAQGAKLTNASHLDLIIDCAGVVQKRGFLSSNNRRLSSLQRLIWPDVVRLDWPDMTAPNHVGLKFWQGLLSQLPEHTCICCIGSHGRTGTCLASLLVADGMDPDLAIVKVRESHCARAIETPEQERYIKELVKGRGEWVR